MLTVRAELAAGAFASINDLNPIKPGQRVMLWAAGEAADGALVAQIGTKTFYRGRTSIETVANAGPLYDQNLIGDWTQPMDMGEQDLQIQNTGAVVVQIQVSKL